MYNLIVHKILKVQASPTLVNLALHIRNTLKITQLLAESKTFPMRKSGRVVQFPNVGWPKASLSLQGLLKTQIPKTTQSESPRKGQGSCILTARLDDSGNHWYGKNSG